MLWLCLRFPLLPLEVFLANQLSSTSSTAVPPGTDQPTSKSAITQASIVIDQHRVLVSNTQATDTGIKPGMSLTTAQALCSDANIFNRDIRQESLALKILAYSCYRFTPAVTLCSSDHLLLEIGGCLKLFKGLQRLLGLINKSITDQGHQHSLGLAATPKAATLLSRADINPQLLCKLLNDKVAFKHCLHALPLTLLDCPNQLKNKFLSTGFNDLGDLLRLPPAALGKRYGKDFLTYLKQLTGEQADPQINFELPPHFESTLAFNDGITSTEILAFPVKRLLAALSGYLYKRQLHCSQIRWTMRLSSINQTNGNSTEIILHFAQPHNSLSHFLSMSRLKLDNLILQSPVESLTLHADRLHQAEQKNIDLFGLQAGNHNNDDQNLIMVLDKLRTRLGENSIYSLGLADSHIPEQAWKTTSFGSEHSRKSSRNHQSKSHQPKNHQSKSSPAKSTPPAISKLNGHDKAANRPLWLLQNPASVKIRNQRLYWRGELQLLQGPERIEGNWWQQAICRDYFIARHHNGALHWIYRDRLSNNWFIHGTFS